MKQITVCEACDGARFGDTEKALAHERLLSVIERIESPLGHAPTGAGFVNGGGYVQHDMNTVKSVKKHLLSLACEMYPSIRNAIAETPF